MWKNSYKIYLLEHISSNLLLIQTGKPYKNQSHIPSEQLTIWSASYTGNAYPSIISLPNKFQGFPSTAMTPISTLCVR